MTVALGTNIANPISTALSQWLGFDTMGKLANYGKLGAAADPDAVITALFANSEQGAFYDPSDLTTMFQDRAGNTPVTADGQTVGKILDKSGRGNHAVAPSDTARPLYKTSGGLHWLQFDGGDDVLETAVINKTTWAGGLLTIGSNANSGSSGGLFKGVDASGYNIHEPLSENNWYPAFGSDTRYGPLSPMAYTTTYVTTRLRNSTESIFRNNASQLTSGVAATNFGAESKLFIGSGNESGTSVFYGGKIFSIVLLARIATTQETTDVENFVAGKTGVFF